MDADDKIAEEPLYTSLWVMIKQFCGCTSDEDDLNARAEKFQRLAQKKLFYNISKELTLKSSNSQPIMEGL